MYSCCYYATEPWSSGVPQNSNILRCYYALLRKNRGETSRDPCTHECVQIRRLREEILVGSAKGRNGRGSGTERTGDGAESGTGFPRISRVVCIVAGRLINRERRTPRRSAPESFFGPESSSPRPRWSDRPQHLLVTDPLRGRN
jgi:hypothetical protein